ncbi:hypothetical protein AQJ11_38935 [Streptomyces corchorusii]|uniref:Uncharacterized protein n=1 Tax=Streptomyces corchorusii TaxID=1903 RepID=A0A101PS87_STRCK|nr:hypothetical protein AQJ11_38935 [Streptomyces corchorusii]
MAVWIDTFHQTVTAMAMTRPTSMATTRANTSWGAPRTTSRDVPVITDAIVAMRGTARCSRTRTWLSIQ